jgi:hypothetical protein
MFHQNISEFLLYSMVLHAGGTFQSRQHENVKFKRFLNFFGNIPPEQGRAADINLPYCRLVSRLLGRVCLISGFMMVCIFGIFYPEDGGNLLFENVG